MTSVSRTSLEQYQTFSVLIVESDVELRFALKKMLSEWLIKVDCVSHINEAQQLRTSYHYDLLVLDCQTFESLSAHQLSDLKPSETQCLLSLVPAKIGAVMTAWKLRGYDFILQPFHREQVLDVVNRCIVNQLEKQRTLVLQQESKKHLLATTLIGNSEKTKYLRQLIKQYASSKAAVLVEGEPRAGKELTARAIHAASGRVGPFVSVNCAGLNASLLRSEVFGHDNGQNIGQLCLANHGTLFLNDVDCLPMSLQSLIVHVFERRTFKTSESQVECLVDVRIIAATTQDLPCLVASGDFSHDLYNRLSVLKIHVPPLRERRADLRELFPYLTKRLCAELSLPVPDWIDGHHFELWDYEWPGNVKELKNLIEKCLLLDQSPLDFQQYGVKSDAANVSNVVVSVSHSNCMPELPSPIRANSGQGYPNDWSLKEIEMRHIQQVVHFYDGNKSAAARQLGISRKTLDRKFKEWQAETHSVFTES